MLLAQVLVAIFFPFKLLNPVLHAARSTIGNPDLTEATLDDELSRPTEADISAARERRGPLLVLGATGKMGPTLVRLALRAAERAGNDQPIYAVARYSDPWRRRQLEQWGATTVAADLLDPDAYAGLPEAADVVFMVGHKFGTAGDPKATWATNVLIPAYAAQRYHNVRIVVFSTGNVYPLVSVASGGATESTAPGPVGDYAASALGRERIFEHFSSVAGTHVTILRLNYAVEPRYGVLRDVADRVYRGDAIDLNMGYVNVIWQRDANAIALRALAHCTAPPLVLNVTGPQTISVRELAERFGEHFGRAPKFSGREAETALLSDARRAVELFGAPSMDLPAMVERIAAWVAGGGASLGKPTHYEQREGRF